MEDPVDEAAELCADRLVEMDVPNADEAAVTNTDAT
jgi:hypothetical protein